MNPSDPKKPGRRRENRIAAVQILYLLDIHRARDEVDIRDLTLSYFETSEHPREYFAFAEELVHGYLEQRESIDESINGLAENWNFDRIARVDLAILRVATYELLHRNDIPPVVTINEAVDIGKEFSNDESRRFINGILDRLSAGLHRDLRKAED